MKIFFLKKYLFTAVFCLLILLASVFLIIEKGDELLGLLLEDDIEVNKIEYFSENLEGQLRNTVYYSRLLNGYGIIQNILLKKEIKNFAYIKEDNGFLYPGSFYQEEDRDLLEYAKRLRKLNEISQAPFIFISPPQKDSSVLSMTEDRELIKKNDRIQDEFLLYLQYVQIDFLDLRSVFKSQNFDELYYKTDTNWTTLAAFEASKAIVEKINSDYQQNLDLKYLNLDNYQSEIYKDMMIGTIGKEVGTTFAGIDDFVLITPKFETDYRWEFVTEDKKEGMQSGSFEESLLMADKLEVKDGYLELPYQSYLNRVNGWDKITNKNNPEGLKILCLRDSWFSPVATFLMPYCSEMHLIAPAKSDLDIETYLAENDFDYVLIEYYPEKITEEGFPFFREE